MPTSAGAAPDGGSAGAAGSVNGGSGAAGAATAGTAGGGSGGMSGGGGTGGSGPKPAIKVWLAGDSTMQSCNTACPCGWGGRFDELFDDGVTVVNRAAGGRSIQTWLYEGAVSNTLDTASGECRLTSSTYAQRWLDMLDESSGMKAGDYLFVQFGINDSDKTCPRHVGLEKLKSYLKVMADAAKSRGATPIFVTPVSAIKCSGATAVGTRGSFVTATKEAASANDVTLVDLHQLSIDRYTALGLCPNDENYGVGKVGAFFCADHTHFESAGALEIAKLVAKASADAKLPLAAYLEP